MKIYSIKIPQILLLLVAKVNILAEYLNYLDVFSKKSAKVLPKPLEAMSKKSSSKRVNSYFMSLFTI